LIQKIEGDNSDITFVRVDSDHIDPRKKDETTISKLSDEEQTGLKTVLEAIVLNKHYTT
jgi:molecular chaperone HtpG